MKAKIAAARRAARQLQVVLSSPMEAGGSRAVLHSQ